MVAQGKSLGTILLAGAFLALGLAGIVVFFSALPRNSSTSPLLALCAFVWSCAFSITAVLTWRRSGFAGFAFVAAIALLLFPAKFVVPDGQLFLPSLWVCIPVALLGFWYLRRVSQSPPKQ